MARMYAAQLNSGVADLDNVCTTYWNYVRANHNNGGCYTPNTCYCHLGASNLHLSCSQAYWNDARCNSYRNSGGIGYYLP